MVFIGIKYLIFQVFFCLWGVGHRKFSIAKRFLSVNFGFLILGISEIIEIGLRRRNILNLMTRILNVRFYVHFLLSINFKLLFFGFC